MSIFTPSHISTVTERSDASVIHQNFVKLHSEIQALKQYVKKLPTEIPPASPANEQKISEVKTAQNLIWDHSFENVKFEGNFFDNIPSGIYPVSDRQNGFPLNWQFDGTNPSVYVAGTEERYFEKVRVLFGRIAAVVDGTVDWNNFDSSDLIEFRLRRRSQLLPSNGKSVISFITVVHAFAEQSGGYNLSAYVASFDGTTTDGQGIMSAVLLSTNSSGNLIRIAKKWELSFPINAGEKFKWYRYSLSIPIEEIGNEHNLAFLIVFESTSPCLVDGVLFAPIPELPLYYPENFFTPPAII